MQYGIYIEVKGIFSSDIVLGPMGSEETRDEYQRIMREINKGYRMITMWEGRAVPAEKITNVVTIDYWKFMRANDLV